MPFILEDLGLKHVFNSDAYFEKISLDQEYYPNDLIHRARINVDDNGNISLKNKNIKHGKKLTINRPFYFIIKDGNNDTILCAGLVNNLSKCEN